MELDDWDKDWLSRSHSETEYRGKVKELMERCAIYAAELEQLRGKRCSYPSCLDGGGRCQAMFKGECAGPNQRRTTI